MAVGVNTHCPHEYSSTKVIIRIGRMSMFVLIGNFLRNSFSHISTTTHIYIFHTVQFIPLESYYCGVRVKQKHNLEDNKTRYKILPCPRIMAGKTYQIIQKAVKIDGFERNKVMKTRG